MNHLPVQQLLTSRVTGFIQIPQEEAMDPENGYRYDLVPMFQNETVNGVEMFVLTAYFVDPGNSSQYIFPIRISYESCNAHMIRFNEFPDIVCTTGRTLFEFMEQGTGTGIYFQNGESSDSPSIKIPSMREEAAAVGWTNCECFPGMVLFQF